jgi:2-oxoglutarate ferredoxin oxidoreductase subunit gamma
MYDIDNILHPSERTDIEIMQLAASAEALKMKHHKVMNMIFLGAYLAKKNLVEKKSVIIALDKVLPEKYHHLIPFNINAFELGEQLAKETDVITV